MRQSVWFELDQEYIESLYLKFYVCLELTFKSTRQILDNWKGGGGICSTASALINRKQTLNVYVKCSTKMVKLSGKCALMAGPV